MTSLRILHLSDTHLFGDDSLHYGVVDTMDHLRRTLAHIDGQRFDLVVCSGDVSEDGTETSYERALSVLVPWAAERGARTVFAMGNHDRREAFRAVLGGGQPGGAGRLPSGEDPARPVVSVAEQSGWRVIVLDSSVPGRGYGALDPAQLAFLREELRAPVEHGTVVVVHHPPVDAQTELLQALALAHEDAAALLDAVADSDVRVILSGHYHLPVVETVRGVPVIVAPGVTNVSRAFEDPREESSIDAFGGVVVTVHDTGVRAVPFIEREDPAAEVFRLDAALTAQIVTTAGRPATD